LNFFRIDNRKFNHDLESKKISNSVSLLEYLESIGLTIPHYCYERRLSISGNCRMCLVEVKGSPKPVISCATSAKSCLTKGSEVYTNSPLVKKAREAVLEFLLVNHPLDCPICDQGGECDLQDQSFFYGSTKKRFYNLKRVVSNKNLGPVVKTVMTRCIHCTRCVRFAEEVAGVADLGTFGRGSNSEIGTYVKKNFQSELAGNVIDLCPVGALTSKPYAFVKRSWELKVVNSIDCTDGFGSNIQVFLKNNKIVKVQPGFNQSLNDFNWITDKARFSFEGMFSTHRFTEGFVEDSKNQIKKKLSWKELLEEISLILYFQDHLNVNYLEPKTLLLVIDNNITLESLNMLLLLSNKYSFVQLRKVEGNSFNLDQESNFLINSGFNDELYFSNVCLLVGVNTRYDGSSLNLKLRARYRKGNFKLVSLGSKLNLTFPVHSLGLNLKTLKDIVSGNHCFCQELLKDSNPIVIVGSEIYNRKDASQIFKLFTLLRKNLNIFYKGWNNIYLLSTAINEVGVNYLKSILSLTEKDLLNNFGIYFINLAENNANFKKIINIKLLNYIKTDDQNSKVIIEHNNSKVSFSLNKKIYNSYSYLNLPNSNFFESKGSYLNTEGIFKSTVKVVSSPSLVKEDWKIFQKILQYSGQISYMSNLKFNNLIFFNSISYVQFKSFIGFLYYPSYSLQKTNRELTRIKMKNTTFIKNDKFKIGRMKIYDTILKVGILDFYIGGKDFYSPSSVTMVKCSKSFRESFINF
jgi:NADH-quinone oxidoreductase chain G